MREIIGLIGSGGHADEVESYLHANGDEVLFRAVHAKYLNNEARVDLNDTPPELLETPVHIAIGAPGLRYLMYEAWKGETYKTIIAPSSYIGNSVEIAEGALVAPQATLTTHVSIGRHAVINVAATIQHGSIIGDFVTVGPGSHIGGNVSVADGAFIGIGAIIKNNVNIARGAVIGAGSTLLHDADVENGVYVGTPARCIRVDEKWLYEL